MKNVSLKDLTEKQRQAILMRYRYRWRMTRIGLELGITQTAATKLLRRAERRAGLIRRCRPRVIRTQPRFAVVHSLSDVFNY